MLEGWRFGCVGLFIRIILFLNYFQVFVNESLLFIKVSDFSLPDLIDFLFYRMSLRLLLESGEVVFYWGNKIWIWFLGQGFKVRLFNEIDILVSNIEVIVLFNELIIEVVLRLVWLDWTQIVVQRSRIWIAALDVWRVQFHEYPIDYISGTLETKSIIRRLTWSNTSWS